MGEGSTGREHTHERMLEVSWEEFGRHSRDLAKRVRDEYVPDCILANSTGGCIVGGTLAAILRLDFYPMRVSRRSRGEVVSDIPQTIVSPSKEISDRKVLLVEDMAVSGDTIERIGKMLQEFSPRDVRTLSLARHNTSYFPDYYAISSDDCVAFPWDRWVYDGESFVIHPELVLAGETSRRSAVLRNG